MKTLIKYLSIIFSLVVLTITGCKHENDINPVEPPVEDPTGGGGTGGGGTGGGGTGGGGTGGGGTNNCDPNIVYFEQQILPIMVSSCGIIGCHNTATGSNEGVVLISYNSLMNSSNAWRHDKSPLDQEFWDVIEDGEMPMSPGTLTQAQKNLIFQWLQQGAQNNSCEPTGTNCDTLNVTFSGTINPIIQNKCIGCHTGSNAAQGINLSAHSGVQIVALNGKLFGAVNHSAGYTPMPFNSNKLPDCEIAQIKVWIDNGAPNN